MSTRSMSPASATERTPLIRDEETNDTNETPKKSNRIPSFIALSILCVAVIIALVAGFAVPAVVEEYTKEAITFEPEDVSIEKFTNDGIYARIHGVFYMDADKVRKSSVRDIGRAATYIAHEVESGDSTVDVYLPEYGSMLLGSVSIPPVKLNIRNAHYNHINFVAKLTPGDLGGIQRLVQDFTNGKEKLDVSAVVTMPVRSGIFSLGTKKVTQFMQIESGPQPDFDIQSLEISEYGSPGHPHGIKAVAKVVAENPHRVRFDVPSIALEILLPDCENGYLVFGTMKTDVVHVVPGNIHAGATAYMSQLPAALTQTCPGSSKSPFDTLVSSYLEGKETKVFIRGGKQDKGTPDWIGKILENVVPAPVPAHQMEDMVKNFSLSDVHFDLPAIPGGSPQLSATVHVTVGLPDEVNFEVGVDSVRADSEVYFEGQKLGRLDLTEWQPSNSSKHGNELWVQSIVKNAPLEITDQEIFTKVVQSMIFGGKGVALGIKALVDVKTKTALGEFVIRKIPSDGKILIKPIGGDGMTHTVKGVEVAGSSPEALIMEAHVEVVNPTDYSANIPHVNVSLYHNDTRIGYGWGAFNIKPGINQVVARASWETGPVARELLSQYISGWNTTLTVKNPQMPGLPTPDMEVTVPMPHMFGKFLRDTTMHILSSTATFILSSPIPMDVITIKSHAFYNGSEIGTIDYDKEFAVAVGDTETPRLPVAWNNNGGLGLIRDALGGRLKLDARAEVGVRIGEWVENIWYEAKGLGANVRL